ncbi:MAG: hypothetical protein A3J24_02535 [Deltaproteobacteria bacterium RIFCSPLOWO2_02_FULL_53_8]|nr:MAG: hypothetical protein A3J24_02535 [Deltaproteobacteria bacterium RIFCSPLOWO2_02_FULL_53_8]
MGKIKNKIISKLLTRFPRLFDRAVDKVAEFKVAGIPWTPVTMPLSAARIGLVTTAGVHLTGQEPFNMDDKDGDPSFRELPTDTPRGGYKITHDYYDHSDADRDINIVFPIDRLNELKKAGEIGGVAAFNYGFMGHIDGRHIEALMKETGPEVARRLVNQGVNAVVLTPG